MSDFTCLSEIRCFYPSSFRLLSPLHNIYDLRCKRPILLILHTNTSTSDKTFRSVEIHKIHKSFGEISDPVHTDW